MQQLDKTEAVLVRGVSIVGGGMFGITQEDGADVLFTVWYTDRFRHPRHKDDIPPPITEEDSDFLFGLEDGTPIEVVVRVRPTTTSTPSRSNW